VTADEMWEELTRRWHPDDPDAPDDNMKRYYQTKFAVAQRLQPRIIGEIGVRAGYSAFAFLSACPGARYAGYDMDAGSWGGKVGFTDHARAVTLAGFDAHITIADSQRILQYRDPVDLFHIDGDHSGVGAMHDMIAAFPASVWMLVDDYDFIPAVREAVRSFLMIQRLAVPAFEYVGDGGFRGNMLIAGGINPLLWDRYA
jgi:hypothetical protein